MTTADMFNTFMVNLGIENRDVISTRYGRITSALNKNFRDTESKTANSLQVGSYGRDTGIRGISDLDMIYVLPKSEWSRFEDERQYLALHETRLAINETYPSTQTRVDRLVVVVTFKNYEIEVQPCFEEDDGSFLYPDTYRKEWLNTNPRSEIQEITECNQAKNGNLKDLCKMTRAWKNKHGQQMGGLLIDTLAYQFITSTDDYDSAGYSLYGEMVSAFFKYLSEEPRDKSRYHALGSGQWVKIKKRFQTKARKAHQLCLTAIDAQGQKNCNDKWRIVFGNAFPAAPVEVAKSDYTFSESKQTWQNTEQFIEDSFPIDIRFNLQIDCTVSQSGYRSETLKNMLKNFWPLKPHKKLQFEVVECDVPEPFELKWKVLNRGDEAKRRNQIRGQIFTDGGNKRRTESTDFRGEHIVECYAIRNGVVVAKDRIDVPITT